MPDLITRGYTLLQQILLQCHPLIAIVSKLSYIIKTLILLQRKPLLQSIYEEEDRLPTGWKNLYLGP